MNTQKVYGMREVLAAILVVATLMLGASITFAQTSSPFTPPTGYSQVGSSGIYYNSATGMYYNPMTGQYSNLQPLGTAQRDANGNFIVGAGYSQFGSAGYYHNSATGYYYDPMTGFYSTAAPVNTGVTLSQARSYTPPGSGGVFTPGVPNTGAGGNAATTFALLAVLAAAAVGGAAAISRRVA